MYSGLPSRTAPPTKLAEEAVRRRGYADHRERVLHGWWSVRPRQDTLYKRTSEAGTIII